MQRETIAFNSEHLEYFQVQMLTLARHNEQRTLRLLAVFPDGKTISQNVQVKPLKKCSSDG